MLTDLGVLDEMRAKWEILKCEEDLLELDVSDMAPGEAAVRIVRHLSELWKPEQSMAGNKES